jgi:hypothetical protein
MTFLRGRYVALSYTRCPVFHFGEATWLVT